MSAGPRAPDAEAIRARLEAAHLPAHAEGARWLLATPARRAPGQAWTAGDDVSLQALYVLPAEAYLGLRSWCDELELLDEAPDFTLDVVALEAEKVARLVLKGHRPTLDWLVRGDEAVVRCEAAGVLEQLAEERTEALAGVAVTEPAPPAPSQVYELLDAWVREVRIGSHG